jgi:pimeloyl-ACP methyl ester carboxylesterase
MSVASVAAISPFEIAIPETELEALQQRLAMTRLPDEPHGAGWDYGANLTYIRDLAGYWRDAFDWRAVERELNSFRHFRVAIDGHLIHFIHAMGVGPRPMPLIITHGWPSTVAEMRAIIGPLSDPVRFGGSAADAFDVVAPSLPGFGFSLSPPARGIIHAHDLWAQLISLLGYDRFGAQGGDFGAGVTSALGLFHADRVIGIHISSDLVSPDPLPPNDAMTEAERDYVRRYARWTDEEGGYAHIQATRPQTLAYGLNDSPVGLAAWIVEKFRAWSDCGGDIERLFTKDSLLTTVSIYWFTQTINSSIRRYYELRRKSFRPPLGKRIEVPAGVAMFPGESELVVPREWAARCYDVRRWTDMPRGGHFAALEAPDLLVEDVRAFFRPLRDN